MGRADDDERLSEVLEWLTDRGFGVIVEEVGEAWECVLVPPQFPGGFVDAGEGATPLEAAEDARRKVAASRGEGITYEVTGRLEGQVGVSASIETEVVRAGGARAGGIPPTEVFGEAPPEVRESLEPMAVEYGWFIGAVTEPDGAIRWFVFDRDRETLLKHGVSLTWDDARLEMIAELYPPSGER